MSKSKRVSELDAKTRGLIEEAVSARSLAYAPYSKYLVGCAVEDGDGEIHTGCNVENASYSAVICAERTAITKMVSVGKKKIRRIVVAASSPVPVFPCGVCLQVIAEFGADSKIIAVDPLGEVYLEASFRQLLPYFFSSEQLPG